MRGYLPDLVGNFSSSESQVAIYVWPRLPSGTEAMVFSNRAHALLRCYSLHCLYVTMSKFLLASDSCIRTPTFGPAEVAVLVPPIASNCTALLGR